MKRCTQSLAIGLAALLGAVAFAPADADAHHRRHRRHIILRVPGPVVHGHVHRSHGPVAFAYRDAEGRAIYQDRRGYFYFGPRGGHVHFVPELPGDA